MIAYVSVDPTSSTAVRVLRQYYVDIIGRYYGRPATDAEVEQTMTRESSADLRGDTGVFMLAKDGEQVLGCCGARYVNADVGELTRVFILQEGRGLGLGAGLIEAVEQAARTTGMRRLRLDVRADLVEAQRLYARLGYREVPAFNDSPYADHWMMKELAPADA